MADATLGPAFFRAAEFLEDHILKLRWYYCVIVNLAATNYPEIIPEVWQHCWQHVCEPLDHEGRFAVAQKMREALTKGCGIMGPAKVPLSNQLAIQACDANNSSLGRHGHQTAGQMYTSRAQGYRE